MSEHMRKHPIKIDATPPVELRLIGPAEKVETLKKSAQKYGFVDMSDSVSMEEAFPGFHSGNTLQGLRAMEELTQVQLAEKTGIPRRHLSEMENGKRPIGKKNAQLLAKALRTNYRVFL